MIFNHCHTIFNQRRHKMKIAADTPIEDIVDIIPDAVNYLYKRGIRCIRVIPRSTKWSECLISPSRFSENKST